ncbi:MAG: xanthine and dehydrogenase maturation factor XdhC/CoxF family-like protein [Bacteroidota bacterium]|nr:xanthine and dehydrogenase maturation factor XdhC/CoxF family-like protein [Bacteroidota bacterium]
MKNLPTWQFIKNNLEKGLGVMLLYVLESKGSSPGRQGFFMSVNTNNEMYGSIGGGIMEHKFVELAKEKLKEENNESLIKKQVHSKSAALNQSGMICSGEQTIFIYKLTNKDQDVINKIINCMEGNQTGTLQLSPKGIDFINAIIDESFSFEYKSDEDWKYAESLGYQNHLYIVGGGHCALAFSNLMRTMDFYIHLIEDRKDLNTFLRNTSAHEKIIVNDYSELDKYIPTGKNNYVVLMTFGYRTDAVALRAIIHNDYKYLGMLGSKTKIEQLFSELKTEGVAAEKIDKVYAPIGIDIKSQTPEEIAVSIAAEIVRVKNE